MDKGRWIVRAASLTILLGFFLPTMLVSCSGGFAQTSQSFSLSDLARQAEQPALYLLPLCAIVVGVLAFLRDESSSQLRLSLWGQLIAMALGLITLLISLISLSNQIQQGTYGLFTVTPDFGAFILIGGLVAFSVGWGMQWQSLGRPKVNVGYIPSVIRNSPQLYSYPEQRAEIDVSPPRLMPDRAYLELVEGNLPIRRIPLQNDNFGIGRSSENQLQLPDASVSRIHALLRSAQGVWFLQDQESSGGTLVNGQNTAAVRLNEGDEIGIGPFRFIFHG